MKQRILIAAGEPEVRAVLLSCLKEAGAECESAESWSELARLERGYDMVVLDRDLPGGDFREILKSLQPQDTEGPLLVATGPDDTEKAVEAMREGAEDYLARPFRSVSVLALRLNRLLVQLRLRKEVGDLRASMRERFQPEGLLGRSKPMQELCKGILKVAPTDAHVLIIGESGTGKEVVARTVHFNSHRAEGRFVAVDCGALTETLLSSELFGHEKGAFTGAVRSRKGMFEEADGGTLLLDEIGNTSPGFQIKLLRVLEEKMVQRVGGNTLIPTDVRVLAATNQDLKAAVGAAKFREDLYYRLNVFELRIPPLRERKEDIPVLAYHFLKQCADRLNKGITRYSETALQRMMEYSWPGNVRELENAVERAVILCDKEEIDDVLPPQGSRGLQAGGPSLYRRPWHEARDQFEIDYFSRLLEDGGWSISHAAEVAKVPRQTIHYKVRKYGLKPRE